jgi:streptogramin lyase
VFVSPSVQSLLARTRFTLFARTRRRPRRTPDHARLGLWLEGLEDRRLLSITEFPLSYPNGGTEPIGIALCSDGNLWFGMSYNGGYIGMINPTTDAISEFPLENISDFSREVAAGPDGNVWFTGYNGDAATQYIGMINSTTHAFSEFAVNTGVNGNGTSRGITAGPDGNLWFTDPYSNAVGMINPTTHAITEFAVPTANAGLVGITTGADGSLWFAEANAGQIAEINPTTRAITEFATPTADSGPIGITTGPDGNLWFTESGANNIGEINPTTHAITEFAVPTANAGLVGITTGADGNLWFAEANAGQIAEINPATHAITEFTVPYSGSIPYEITAGPDGNLWFTDASNDNGAIGVATPNADHFVLTQQPPTSVTAGTPFGLAVEAEDSSGVLDSSFNGTVTVALANKPTGATLGGTLSVTANQGVATFSDLTLTQAASGYTLVVASSGVNDATTSAITVTAATASQLVIGTQPSATATAGQAFGAQPVIDEEDQFGNLETADNTTAVTASLESGTGPLQGTATVTVSGGVATFTNLADNKAETISLNFTSGSLTRASSTSIVVSPAAASSLAFSGLPGTVTAGTAFNFTVTAYDAYNNVATGYTGTVHFTSSDAAATLPANYTFDSGKTGTQSFSATLNTSGAQTITAADTVTSSITGKGSVNVESSTASATFLKTDSTTEGSWIGVYGSQGYNVINATNGVDYPSYATVTPAGNTPYTWAASTNVVQALQNPSGSGRVAAAWYASTSFTVDVDLTDGQSHNIELYLLDYDSNSRSEQIVFTDANTHAVLSTQTVSSFHTGVYMNYTISGNVLITITKEAGSNAVLSGLFFDSSPATAAFLAKDSTTQGNWKGVYGSQGYNVINSGVSYPSYATVTPASKLTYTWAASTSVPQALQDAPPATSRIAAAWYASTSLTVDVDLTDGQSHDIELYLLDYDSTSRSEQIVVSDASTHAVLSTQIVSSFHGGVYMNYTISGKVLITLTKTGANNAVLSGLFFDPMASPTTTGVTSSLNPSTSGQSVTFTATVSDTSGGMPTGGVDFYDGSTDLGPGSALSGSGNSATSTFTTSTLTADSHSISAVYSSTGDFAGSSGNLTQTVNTPPATAGFNGKDTTTEGSWIGVYGSQGYNVINATNGVDYPSYATVTPGGNKSYTWSANINALPALRNPSGSGRIAAAWYASTSFTVDVDLTDGQAHNIELYLLDYDSTSRSEQIVFSDANSHAVLSTQTVSSFHDGVYMSWTISGNVLITITKTGGANAVLSGLFFDPTTTGPAVVRAGNSAGGLVDATAVSSRLATDPIGTLDPPSAPQSFLSTTALLSVHDAALVGSGIIASSNPVNDPIGTVDPSDNDSAALSLVSEPINPNGKLVHDLALEQVSIGQTRSWARFGQRSGLPTR